MNRVVIGILAHVDSGKTTLSEGMLYSAGEIRKIGRVDHGDAFLDSHEIERDKGITIFSKQAVMRFRDTEFTLLTLPGHVDFSTEMERTLSVLDYAIPRYKRYGRDTKSYRNTMAAFGTIQCTYIYIREQNGPKRRQKRRS